MPEIDHAFDAPFEQHRWVYHDDEYDSLANGGSYAIYTCECGARSYSMLAD